jgi:hypothetical protein
MGRFVPWVLLPRFGRAGSEGLGAGLGVGVEGLVGGDGRLTGVVGVFCDNDAEGFLAGLFVLVITGCLGDVGLGEVSLGARFGRLGLRGEVGLLGVSGVCPPTFFF